MSVVCSVRCSFQCAIISVALASSSPTTTQPNPTQSNPTEPTPTQSNPNQSNPNQSNPIQPNPTQSNPIQPNPTHPNPTSSSASDTFCSTYKIQIWNQKPEIDNILYSEPWSDTEVTPASKSWSKRCFKNSPSSKSDSKLLQNCSSTFTPDSTKFKISRIETRVSWTKNQSWELKSCPRCKIKILLLVQNLKTARSHLLKCTPVKENMLWWNIFK